MSKIHCAHDDDGSSQTACSRGEINDRSAEPFEDSPIRCQRQACASGGSLHIGELDLYSDHTSVFSSGSHLQILVK